VAVLTVGNLLVIVEGPVQADGYAWFRGDRPGSLGSGWVTEDFLALV
jgi:hypothetical protein